MNLLLSLYKKGLLDYHTDILQNCLGRHFYFYLLGISKCLMKKKIICFTLLYIIYLSSPTYRSLSREAFIYQIPNLKFLQKFCTVILLIMFYRNITFDPVILTSETILLVVKPLDLTRVITII